MAEFRMPSLGADMTAGKLVEWLKHPGDAVHRGEIIAVVETQKGAIEVEIFEDGIVERLLVAPGSSVPVGTPLALIAGTRAAAAPVIAAPVIAAPVIAAPVIAAPVIAAPVIAAPAPAPAAPPAAARPAPSPKPEPSPGLRRHVSPAARRIAAERGIDLAGLHGTGPSGAVISRDLEPAGVAPARRPVTRGFDTAEMRRAIAAAMARSKREIPHYYLATTIDIARAVAWLETTNAVRAPSQRLLLAAVLLRAVALALRAAPELNGTYGGDGFRPSPAIHLGVAVALRGGGLVAPAIHDADKLAVDEVMARLRDLVTRARGGGLRSSELSDPTITVTSLGDRGVEEIFGVIYPPQVAMVGFGTPALRPWVVAGQVVPRWTLRASLSADHRASDGHRAALFLADLDRRLQEPETL